MDGTERRISAAQATRNFGQVQDEVANGPIVLTHHGRPRLVMVSIAEYQRLADAEPEREAAPASGPDMRGMAAILDAFPECYLAIDREDRFTAINRAAELYIGRPREELLGGRFPELFDSPGIASLALRFREAREQGAVVNFVWDSVLHDGRRVEVQVLPLPLTDGGVGVFFRSVGERERLEAQLACAEAQVAALLAEDVGKALIVFDSDGMVTAWKGAAENLLGWSEADAVGRSVERIFPEEELAAGAPWALMAKARRAQSEETVGHLVDRSSKPVQLRRSLSFQSASGCYLLMAETPKTAARDS